MVPLTVGSTVAWGSGWSWTTSGALWAVATRPGEETLAMRTIVWPSSAALSV